MAARNLQTALERIAEILDACDKDRVALREVIARCRMRDRREMAQYTDAELRELIEHSYAKAALPVGVVGEAALAYSVSMRSGSNPVSSALSALRQHGANDDWSRRALVAWIDDVAEREAAQAAALTHFRDAKFGKKGEVPQ